MNFFDLVHKYVTLRKQGAYMIGPCPKCGGAPDSTRFVVNLAKDFGNCYSCGFNADSVRLLRVMEGMTCPEAHRAVGVECDFYNCPVSDQCRRGKSESTKCADRNNTVQTSQSKQHEFAPIAVDNPVEAWQCHAMTMVTTSHERLLACPEQLDYLAGRGLPLDAVTKYHLGWIPKVEFKARKAWGLENKWNEKEQRSITSLAFQQGILIPWIIDGHIHRLRVRKTVVKDKKDPRYLWIEGSGNDIICLNPSAKAHCVVESDLDGLLIDWIAGDFVGAVPLGSCSTKPKSTVMGLLRSSLRILVALDSDGVIRDNRVHAPGAKASLWWLETFPAAARRWPVPQGKDPGEAYTAGSDLRVWIIAGLPSTMQWSANKGAKQLPHAVAEEACRESPMIAAPLVYTIQAKDGREINITDDPAEYQRLVVAKKVVFSSREIAFVNTAVVDQDQAKYFIDIKAVFPGTKITKVEKLTSEGGNYE